MALHPDWFKQWEPLPPKGTRIICHYKDGHEVEGVLDIIWLSLDTLAFRVLTDAKGFINFLPEFEDGWTEYAVTTRRRIQ